MADDLIVEVALQPTADSIRLEWGLTINNERKWAFPHRRLEVRLYCVSTAIVLCTNRMPANRVKCCRM